MMNTVNVKFYSPAEERINITSHALGLILSVIALVLLVARAAMYGNVWHIISFSIFGLSLIMLYAASTLYHSSKDAKLRSRLRIVDHATIYILIAGTYTPFTLVTLNGFTGWWIFGVTWGLALTGIILKLFFTGRFEIASTLMYVFMGWVIVFAIEPLVNSFSTEGIAWLVAGGIAYTLGAILYGVRIMKYNHATFHVFVLIGSAMHFVSVFFYVLPSS
ncbi:MAG: hemolysin III family protein [Gammaproteobacteria bacterium]|jgi:hemolysin III